MSRSNSILTDLKTAARGGSLSACFVLGRLYDEGWGVVRNPRSAARWYLLAGKGGLPEAYYFVASAYDAGDGVAANGTQALAWYRRAAAAGDRDAKFILAVRMLDGRGVRKDAAKGIRLLKRIALDDAGAMDYLAHHYLKQGRFSLAKKWATRAAKHGESDAPARLAEIENARRLGLTRHEKRRV